MFECMAKTLVLWTLKYLGVIVDKGMTFISHVRDPCLRVKRMALVLRKKIFTVWSVDLSTSLKTIYGCAVITIISYGFEVWGSKIHTRCIRDLLLSVYGVCQSTLCAGL